MRVRSWVTRTSPALANKQRCYEDKPHWTKGHIATRALSAISHPSYCYKCYVTEIINIDSVFVSISDALYSGLVVEWSQKLHFQLIIILEKSHYKNDWGWGGGVWEHPLKVHGGVFPYLSLGGNCNNPTQTSTQP